MALCELGVLRLSAPLPCLIVERRCIDGKTAADYGEPFLSPRVEDHEAIAEAVAMFAARAFEKLRKRELVASAIASALLEQIYLVLGQPRADFSLRSGGTNGAFGLQFGFGNKWSIADPSKQLRLLRFHFHDEREDVQQVQ